MNAPSHIHPALRLDRDQIHNVIAKTNALLANPERDGIAWLNWLCACDVLIGSDALTSEIEDAECDLRLGDADEPQCLICSTDCDGACDNALTYVERISPTSIAA